MATVGDKRERRVPRGTTYPTPSGGAIGPQDDGEDDRPESARPPRTLSAAPPNPVQSQIIADLKTRIAELELELARKNE